MTAVSQSTTATFREHLAELRKRLFFSLIVFVIFSGVGWSIHAQLLQILVKPLGQQLVYSTPTGGFEFVINISLYFGIALSLPFILYNILQFIKPAIPGRVVIKTGQTIFWAYLLIASGVVFAYNYSLPFALKFLNAFSTEDVRSLITTNSYLSFTAIYLLGFGAIFLLPLVLLTINNITRLSTKTLNKHQGKIILGSFIVAAILTPTPDPINQTIMATPIIILYELSILLVWLRNRNRRKPVGDSTSSEENADQLYKSGNLSAAEAIYEKLCASDNASAKAHARLGIIYINNKKFTEARTELYKALDKDSSIASYHANLGMALIGLELPGEAIEAFGEAIRLAPENSKYRQLYKLAQDMKGDDIRLWE